MSKERKNLSMQIGQLKVSTAGAGEINLVSIPQNLSPTKFKVHSLALYISDDNVNGTIAAPFPKPTAPNVSSLAYILDGAVNANPGALTADSPSSFVLSEFGTAGIVTKVYENLGAGTSRSIWVLDSNRELYIPEQYKFGVFIVDANDGTNHFISATIYAQCEIEC
jgi:hypothetical protein